jgi:hypothetical protein
MYRCAVLGYSRVISGENRVKYFHANAHRAVQADKQKGHPGK